MIGLVLKIRDHVLDDGAADTTGNPDREVESRFRMSLPAKAATIFGVCLDRARGHRSSQLIVAKELLPSLTMTEFPTKSIALTPDAGRIEKKRHRILPHEV